jgi:DNA-binding transcriptional regulator YdaS (Cro superfamily)
MSTLTQAVEAAGGVGKLAASIGVAQNVVSNWRKRGKVPAEHVLAVEAASGVSRHALRPDVFGPMPANDANPASAAA